MEYLVIGHVVRGYETDWKSVEHCIAARRGLQQFQGDSRTKTIYGFAGKLSGCLIVEVKSPQELDDYLLLNPWTQLIDWEVHSLTIADQLKATLDKVESQLVSGPTRTYPGGTTSAKAQLAQEKEKQPLEETKQMVERFMQELREKSAQISKDYPNLAEEKARQRVEETKQMVERFIQELSAQPLSA